MWVHTCQRVCLRDSRVWDRASMTWLQRRLCVCMCLCVHRAQRDGRSQSPGSPRCLCGQENVCCSVHLAAGAHRRARLEGTSDGVTGREQACVCVCVCACVCVCERERRQGERGLELEPLLQQQVGPGLPGLTRDSRILIVHGDDGALGSCQRCSESCSRLLALLVGQHPSARLPGTGCSSFLRLRPPPPLPARLPPSLPLSASERHV